MSQDRSLVESEIQDYLTNIGEWIAKVQGVPVQESYKGVIDRFVRDCSNFRSDVEEKESPSSPDLVDFTDRHNSLEIQYHNILSDLT
jgi:hypothetical protein